MSTATAPDTQFATVHNEVNARMALTDAHYLVNAIEADFKEELGITLVSILIPLTWMMTHESNFTITSKTSSNPMIPL